MVTAEDRSLDAGGVASGRVGSEAQGGAVLGAVGAALADDELEGLDDDRDGAGDGGDGKHWQASGGDV
jgi:hypothetical protein